MHAPRLHVLLQGTCPASELSNPLRNSKYDDFARTQVFIISVDENSQKDLQPLAELGPFSAWTLDIHLHEISSSDALCVVGLSNNTLIVSRLQWNCNSHKMVRQVCRAAHFLCKEVVKVPHNMCSNDLQEVLSTNLAQCQERLLLYSMSLHVPAQVCVLQPAPSPAVIVGAQACSLTAFCAKTGWHQN
jgi:hypothetical protein